jgi:hypothetical protein
MPRVSPLHSQVVVRSQAGGVFFDIARVAEGFHGSCLDLVSVPDWVLPLCRLSAFFVEQTFVSEDRQSHPFRAGAWPQPLAPRAATIHPQAETACELLHSTGRGFSSRLVAWVPIFAFRRARERPSVEPVNPASVRAAFAIRLKRDRTNQPGPIFPRSPGIILNGPARNFHFDQPVVLSMNGNKTSRISRSVN